MPAFIIKRLPVRYTYDNNYFNDRFQGIPMGGYTKMIERMLEGIEVRLGVDFLKHREEYEPWQIQLSIQVLLMNTLVILKVF